MITVASVRAFPEVALPPCWLYSTLALPVKAVRFISLFIVVLLLKLDATSGTVVAVEESAGFNKSSKSRIILPFPPVTLSVWV